MERVWCEGVGFRVGLDLGKGEFVGLVGTGEWAIELTMAELRDFCRLVRELASAMAAMAGELMDEESLDIELESDRIWMAGEGFPSAFSLRFILQDGRGVEGLFGSSAVAGVVAGALAVESAIGRSAVENF